MSRLFWPLLILLVLLVAWNVGLRRQLLAARMRGDMYRDISTRLDQRLGANSNH